MNPQPSHRPSTAGKDRQEEMCSNICRIYISSCHEAAEKWKREISTDISRKEIHHLCCAGSSCALCLTVGNDCGSSACQRFVLVVVGLCPGQHEEPWAHSLMLLEARAGYTNPSLLAESHDKADMNKMWETPSQILQMLFSSKHKLPFLPHFSMLPATPPDVTAGVTLLPSCFSSTCIWTNWFHSNTTLHLL